MLNLSSCNVQYLFAVLVAKLREKRPEMSLYEAILGTSIKMSIEGLSNPAPLTFNRPTSPIFM